jgi:hypothetical protein
MVRRVGRKNVAMRRGYYLRSAALLKQALLKLGVGAILCHVDVNRGRTTGLLSLLTRNCRRQAKSYLHLLFSTGSRPLSEDKNSRLDEGAP